MNNKSNEAAAVAFFSYKREDGFEVSLTLRDDTGEAVLSRIEGAIQQVKKENGTPVAKYQAFASKYPKKEVQYVEDRVCPLCQNKLVYGQTKDNRRYIKCSTSKYDFQTKQSSGCKHFEWVATAPGENYY